MSLFMIWSSVVCTVSFPTWKTQNCAFKKELLPLKIRLFYASLCPSNQRISGVAGVFYHPSQRQWFVPDTQMVKMNADFKTMNSHGGYKQSLLSSNRQITTFVMRRKTREERQIKVSVFDTRPHILFKSFSKLSLLKGPRKIHPGNLQYGHK